MASTDPSRRASLASSSELSLVEPNAAKNLPLKQDKSTGGVKLKKSIAKTKPKNSMKAGGNTRSPSPDSSAITASASKAVDSTDLVDCKHCKKSVPASEAVSHATKCLKEKAEKARKKKEAKEAKANEAKAKEAAGDKDKDGDSVMGDSINASRRDNDLDKAESGSTKKPPKKSSSKASTDGLKKSKKRKADGEADKEPKKKKLKKDEPPKPKLPKPKGPVNVEQQCGVSLPNGGFCARSLTCKSHSMGAKRSVPGRSLPYDQLLAMYQKRNQAKIQKAALEAKAPLLDDGPPEGPVDSDEEKDAVMGAIARSRPVPLEQYVLVSTTRKYKDIRMKEMLGNALGARGPSGGGLFGSGAKEPVMPESVAQSSLVVTSDTPNGEGPSSRKASLVHQVQGRVPTGGVNPPAPGRKASVA